MTKFHINKHGVPAPCKASKGKCPLGGDSGNENHFNTQEEAQIAADRANAKKHGIISGINNTSEMNVKVSEEDFNNVFLDSYNEHGYMVTGPHSTDFEDLKDEPGYKSVYDNLPQEFHDQMADKVPWTMVKEGNIETHMRNHVISIRYEGDDRESQLHGIEMPCL